MWTYAYKNSCKRVTNAARALGFKAWAQLKLFWHTHRHIYMPQCQHTNTHNNNIFTQWSWISKKVLADIPTEVKMFYLLLFSLQTQAYTPMHRKINTHSGFVTFEDTEHSFLWGSPLTLKSATIGHSEAQPKQSPPSLKYTNKNKGMSRDCPQKYS